VLRRALVCVLPMQINDKDELVGVAFQTLASHDADNIGYVIPVDILVHFLTDIERHGGYTGTSHRPPILHGMPSACIHHHLFHPLLPLTLASPSPYTHKRTHKHKYKHTGFCSLGVKFQPMESAFLRRFKKVPEGASGVLITKVDPLAPSNEVAG
jgi:S1-C subfamily serine protease